MKKILLLLVTVLLIINTGFAQKDGDTIPIGKYRKIFSKVLNEERNILISLPPGYENSKKEYPVIYITDGSENNFLRSAGIIRYFTPDRFPEMIVVGIPNTNRARDLYFKPWEFSENSGGGENFLTFLTKELTPFVDKNYRTTNYRMLVGFSAGGSFVLDAFLTKPESFDASISCGPFLEYADNYFQDKAGNFFKKDKSLRNYLYINYGEKDYTIVAYSVPEFIRLLEAKAPEGLKWEVNVVEGEGHVPFTSLYDGLTALFSDWKPVQPPEILPSNGSFPEGKSITASITGEMGDIRYTLDGTEPTRKSSVYKKPIIIEKPVTLKAKTFRKNLAESSTISAEFNYAPVRSSEKNLSDPKRGVTYEYFEKRLWFFNESISLDSFEPVKSGVSETIDLSSRNRDDGFIFRFKGFIDIAKQGVYRFYLYSNGVSQLFIGDDLLIHNGSFNSFEEKSYEIRLEAGKHPLTVHYTNPWLMGQVIEVSYEGPGIEKQEIPTEVLYH